MYRRIVLVDQEETKNYASLFGRGFGNNIYTLQALQSMDEENLKKFLTFGEGEAIMLIGAEPFRFLKQYYHFGIRSENYYDCSKLRRLSIEGGAFVKEVLDIPTDEEINDFLDPDFTKKVEFPGFKQYIIHTYQDAISFLDTIDSLPLDTDLGFDYEASGMPLDVWFEISGASIATENYSGFISFTDIRHQIGKESSEYQYLLKRLGEILVKRMSHVWAYNMQYEFQVSHRMLGVDLYNLCDASVVNTMDGNHMKKYSLKWTGQNVLEVNTWDVEFDKISDLIDSMLFTEEGKLKKDKHQVLKVDQTNFDQTPEWAELIHRYPQYESEFRSLILEYWGNAFMCIPSEILGYYCNLDAFYTLMIYKKRQNDYSQDCWNVNLDNIRLGCRLMSSGLYIDEPFRAKYENYCHEMMAWGITYCAIARCYVKMQKHQALANNIKRYKPVAVKLLEDGQFYQGDIMEITKNLLYNNLDTMDTTETGLNEGKIAMKFGDKFASELVDIVKAAMCEVKMKGKIDEGIKRKKKILTVISEKLIPIIGLDKIKLGEKHNELEKYMYYQRAYKELLRVSGNQLCDIQNIPDKIYLFGKYMSLLEYADFVSDNYFKCKSPLENDEIAYEFTMLYRPQTSFLAAMIESTQQLPETDKFYSSRGITDINVGFNEFMKEWENYFKNGHLSQLYPEKAFTLALEHYQSPKKEKDTKKSKEGNPVYIYNCSDKVKEMWTDFNGWTAQAQFFPDMAGQYKSYETMFDPTDMQDDFYFMRKLTLNYLLFKKYSKLNSTYVGSDGMFKKNNRFVIENEDHIPLRYADPTEPGAVEKCFVHYEVQTKSSKRWSSGFHTIISHGDCKDVLCPPPVKDEFGNIIPGKHNQFLTYFDISSAEVKAAGYASKDPDLIAKFNAGEDIYIYSAQLYLGEDGWNSLSKKDKKKWRKRFKTIFLGVLYGLGKQSLAERLDSSVEEAEDIIQGLYKSFPQLRVYVDSQGKYPLQHDGYINTMLGDKLQIKEYSEYLPKAKTDRERKNLEARISRLGVNL